MACRLSVGFVDVTLYSRNESTKRGDFEARRAIESAQTLHLSVDGSDSLRRFLGRHTSGGYLSSDTHPSDVLRRLKDGVASGDIVAVSSPRESRQADSGGRARAATASLLCDGNAFAALSQSCARKTRQRARARRPVMAEASG